jgi:predicted DNA-binding protein
MKIEADPNSSDHTAAGQLAYCKCITLHYMADQTSFRLPTRLARALDRAARSRGVPKSQLVREALELYLAEDGLTRSTAAVKERSARYIGSVRLDRRALDGDDTARMIRQRNWRE